MKQIVTLFLIINIISITSIKSKVWDPNLDSINFKNPIIFADYSDPDIIRVSEDFYMVASSFNCMPGIPILHSNDLINWEIINHVYDRLPLERYNKPIHGEGSWAPALRYHNNKFYVYFCTPHDGLFMAVTDDPASKWELNHVVKIDNWEDPCPIWDDNGKAYLVRSKLCGEELYLHQMSADGKTILDNGVLIFKDEKVPVIEGPKFLKKDDYYYILAPGGGVPTGWQEVLRSKNIYGPYERKTVLHTGNTNINGPHQGGLVELESGEWWFAHFQDRNFYGRIVHLQPVNWENGWPLMGKDMNNDGVGEPVMTYQKPTVVKTYPVKIPQTSDEFNSDKLGLQWQWHANWLKEWYSLTDIPGSIKLNAVRNHSQMGNFWFVPNLLLQKFPSPQFSATTKLKFSGDLVGDQCGLTIMGEKWAFISIEKTKEGLKLRMSKGAYHQCDDLTETLSSISIDSNEIYLKVEVNESGSCQFSYSFNHDLFYNIGESFQAEKGRWIGAKVGLFCINPNINESKGYAEFDWFRME